MKKVIIPLTIILILLGICIILVLTDTSLAASMPIKMFEIYE